MSDNPAAFPAAPANGGAYLVKHDNAHQDVNLFLPAMTMATALARRETLIQFTSQIMKPEVDYGIIPGTPKPTLLKPGAEKLCNFFGLEPIYEEIKEIADWTGREYGEPFYYIRYRCQLRKDLKIIGSGEGSSNTWESKHRYRWVREEDVPHGLMIGTLKKRGGIRAIFEPDFALAKKETGGRYGKPAEYWQKFEDAIAAKTAKRTRKALGQKQFDGYEISVDEVQYRIPNPDFPDLVNTIQKMAQKRALIAAALIGTSASEFFTQDVEDLPEFRQQSTAAPEPEPPQQEEKPPAPAPPPPAAHPQPDVKTTEPAAAPPPKIEDKRKALSIEVREALGLSPTADTNVATAVAKVYRGYIGAPKSGKLPDAQANDLNRWHECLIGLRDGIKGQLITKDDLQKDAYSVGVQLRQVVDAAPEEEPDAAEPQQSAAAPVDVTDEMLQQRWGTPTLKGANWLANLLGKANLPARDDAELAAFRRLAYHTKMVGLAVSPKFTLAQVVKGVEATIGKTLTADPALTADMEVALTQVVNGLNGVVTQ